MTTATKPPDRTAPEQRFVDFLSKPVAAGVALYPAWPGLVNRCDAQLEQTIARMTVRQWGRGATAAVPYVAATVWAQMTAQGLVEGAMPPGFPAAVAGAMAAGGGSAHFQSAIQALAARQSAWQAMRGLTGWQVLMFGSRETAFLGGLRASAPLSNWAKERLGDSVAVEQGANFVSGAAGGIFGTPFDTLITRSQAKKSTQWNQLMLGWKWRGLATGTFGVTYGLTQKLIKSLAD
jgi:hypothetical protein